MPGPVALVGAGEFLPAMAEFDLGLLAATGRPRPRVVLLPTASGRDAGEELERRAADGIAHFSALGAEVEPILAVDRAAASDGAHVQALGEADLVYLCGGRADALLRILAGTPLGDAVRAAHGRGAVVAGCAAGAMVLAARQWAFRRRLLPWPLRWRAGLAIVEGVAVIPDYDSLPEPLAALIALQAPRGAVVLGVDRETGLVGRDQAWQVHGRGRVTVWRRRRRERYRAGEVFRL